MEGQITHQIYYLPPSQLITMIDPMYTEFEMGIGNVGNGMTFQ